MSTKHAYLDIYPSQIEALNTKAGSLIELIISESGAKAPGAKEVLEIFAHSLGFNNHRELLANAKELILLDTEQDLRLFTLRPVISLIEEKLISNIEGLSKEQANLICSKLKTTERRHLMLGGMAKAMDKVQHCGKTGTI